VVKLNQKVMVTVTEVDVSRKRIALTMKEKSAGHESRPAGGGKNFVADKNNNNMKEPLNSFQTKLMDLKKKFNE